MCEMASFKYRPDTQEVVVSVLDPHGKTEIKLNLSAKLWHDGHYLPNGDIVCRLPKNKRDKKTETYIRERWPKFVDFFNWALITTGQEKIYSGSLDLRSLTSAAGLKLPTEISGYLDLIDKVKAELAELKS